MQEQYGIQVGHFCLALALGVITNQMNIKSHLLSVEETAFLSLPSGGH